MQNRFFTRMAPWMLLPAALWLGSVQAAAKTPKAQTETPNSSPTTMTGGNTPDNTSTTTPAALDNRTAPSTQEQKLSYAIGINIGDSLRQQEIHVSMDSFIQGIKDSLTKTTPLMSPEEIRTVLAGFQEEQRKQLEEQRKVSAVKNTNEGKAFLEANKSKPGVITLPSGLQYKINQEGKGDSPKPTDIVTVNYRGTLIDGTEFDSSEKHGQSATFPVNGVIPGWTEALQLMKPGAKWTVYIPSNLAYGENGAGRVIGPNSTLIFDIELLSVKKPDVASPPNENTSKSANTQ